MPKNHEELWHVVDMGRPFGPYTTDMLEARVAQGRFSKAALVWKSGLSSWQPITLHFSLADVNSGAENLANERAVLPVIPRISNKPPIKLWMLFAGTLLLFGILATGNSASNEWSVAAFLTGRIGTIIALFCLGFLAALSWWRWSRSGVLSDKAGGLIRVFVVLCGAAVGVAVLVAAVRTPLLYRLQIARQSLNHYSVTVDIGTRTILIQGTIGPGMAAEVARQLDANAAIRTVTLDSIGGLVQEALIIARDVQAHGLATQVRHQCNSACIVIFMAGNKRVAPYNFTFGFHAVSPVTRMTGTYDLAALDAEKNEANAYLVARGVPSQFIEATDAVGPDKLYFVSAVRMADAGAVTGLLDGQTEVSVADAKWLSVIDIEKRSHAPQALLNLLSTMTRLDPTLPATFGPGLWAAGQSGDASAVAATMHSMVVKLAARALPSADDDSVAAVVKVTSAELQYLREKEEWAVCVGLINGKGFGATKPPEDLAQEDFAAQNALLVSGAKNQWQPRDTPVWASAAGADMAKALATAMIAEGFNLQNLDKDSRTSCEWTSRYLAAISQKPSPTASGLYRWLIAGAK